jgi:probable phosphoglycerate mutase
MPRADSTTGTRPDREANTDPKATPATVILLVRHGTTATTGTKLPGRAPGLHLAESGRRQAADVAARIVRLTTRARDADHAPPAGNGTTPGDSGTGTDADGTGTGRAGGPGTTAVPPDGPAPAPATPPAAHGGAEAPAAPGVAAVYSSPLERTRETAAPIAQAVDRPVEIDEALVELDVGEWTGIDLKEARSRREWATIQRYPSGFRFPGGESFLDMQTRMVEALDRLRARHPGETVVAVSHADPIRAVVAHALGTHLDLFQRIVVSPCSLTAIVLGDEGPTVLSVNTTGESSALVPS